MDIKETMQHIIAVESQAVSRIPWTDDYQRAVEFIVDRVNRKGGKLVTSGMGKAGHIAMNIATTFSSTGTPAVSIHPCDAQHGDLGVVQPNDVVLLVSNSGQTTEIVKLAELVNTLFDEHIPVIAITGVADSPLAKIADATLLTGDAPEVCPLGLTPTTSITLMTVISDILVVNIMQQIGFTRAEYSRRHFGGVLGVKSRS